MAGFIEHLSEKDRLWIAETQGEFAGSVAVVRQDDTTAQLRWLIVEPKARGRGIGRQLIAEAVRFARDKVMASHPSRPQAAVPVIHLRQRMRRSQTGRQAPAPACHLISTRPHRPGFR
ncbi:GNAT family N-acetyltransferase [Desulfobacter vibrioformis]|uniref:GNAT family N-acetyltransferase n=1 Tax=Desulfobacter vibrioformis TaxID=34031 RepID=UPI000A056215